MKECGKEISRRKAIKEIGFGAYTVGTMMTILNGNAQENWGCWDDVNQEVGLRSVRSSGPAASIDGGLVSHNLSVYTAAVAHGTNYSLSAYVTNNGTNAVNEINATVYHNDTYIGVGKIRNLGVGRTGSMSVKVSNKLTPVSIVVNVENSTYTYFREVNYP